jgi:hypothetical protein
MTSRITHDKLLPKNMAYWDYFILCRLDMNAAMALQRMEYWDGTKADGNIHSEQINEQLASAGYAGTQDTSRFVFKSQEELSWELIGSCSMRALPAVMELLVGTLHYLTWRNNPYNIIDHTRQYCFQATLVQSHLDRLVSLVKHFLELGREERPVLYAIEQLTAEGYYIAQVAQEDGRIVERTDGELLTRERIAQKLEALHKIMHEDESQAQLAKTAGKRFKYRLPRFVHTDLKKDEAASFPSRHGTYVVSTPQDCRVDTAHMQERDGKSAVSTQQNCCADTAHMQERDGNFAVTIPVITSVTTSTDYTRARADHVATPSLSDASHTHDFSSLLAAVTTLPDEQREQLARFLLGPSSARPHETTGPSNPPAEQALMLPPSTRIAADPSQRDEATDKDNTIQIAIAPSAASVSRDEARDASMVRATSVDDEAATPATHSEPPGEPPKPAKARKKKTNVSLTDATPVPIPEKPTSDEPWTPLTCLKLADYYRGEPLPESERKDSPYQKAVQAAISLVNRQRMTYEQVDVVFRYMKGIDASLKDDWWTDKKVDLWHVAEHCTVKLRERERKARKTELVVSGPAPCSPERPSVLISEEKRQRNLERLRVLAQAKAPQEHEQVAARVG